MQSTQPPRNVRTRELLIASWRAAQKHAEQTGMLSQHPVSAAGELVAATSRLVPARDVVAVAIDVAEERAKEFPWWAGVADVLRKVDIEERADRCEPKVADVFGDAVRVAPKVRLVTDGGF